MRKLLLIACAAAMLSGCIAWDDMYDDQAREQCDSETTARERGECYDRIEQQRREQR
jgi:hypothetical protein